MGKIVPSEYQEKIFDFIKNGVGNAVIEAKKLGLITVGLTGQKSAKMDEYCDYLIKVPSDTTPIVQESHLMLEHIICAKVEEEIFKE
jgi:D-sedoheptulose 7-phosphate isomerase